MCSKEAWEHFIFVPRLPHRRIERCAARSADYSQFLRVCSRPVVPFEDAQEDRCSGCATSQSSKSIVKASASGGSKTGEASLALISTAATTLTALAAAAITAKGVAGVAAVKMGMMPAQMIPAGLPPTRDDVAMEAGRGGFLDLLFPGFDVNTFVWRVSMLQIAEYIGSLLMGSTFGAPKLCSLYLLGASWGPAIADGAVWRLFLPIMLHANALHIFFNLFFQLRIGFGMEKQFGRRKFCLLYIFCGFLGNLLSVSFDPMKLAVGASTSGFGLLGVWLAEVCLTWELLGGSRPRVFLWFAFMVLSCVMMSTISPNVDFVGHFGGAAAGFLMAIILADMREEHQPSWYGKAKTAAKNTAALMILVCLFKAITMGPDGPVPFCGNILHPRQLPF
mmetsp:Transcript_14366/g.26148  ORF Transcript_14366/g.26148 Transcript_14366/m.26148 type:complete len:392 (+) Transcript_14366:90-1265(+)